MKLTTILILSFVFVGIVGSVVGTSYSYYEAKEVLEEYLKLLPTLAGQVESA